MGWYVNLNAIAISEAHTRMKNSALSHQDYFIMMSLQN